MQWIPVGKKLPKDKVIWYQFREPLPAVSPGKLQAPARPRVDRKAVQQIIAAPAAKPGKQFVWMPAQPELKIQPDIRTATLLAIDIPLPPAPPKPRVFVPPPVVVTPKPVDTRILSAAPEISSTTAVAVNPPVLTPQPGKPKPKAFQPAPQVTNGRPMDNPSMPVPPGINSGAGIQATSTALDQNWMQPAPPPMPREQVDDPAGARAAASGTNLPSGAEASVAAINVDRIDTPRMPKEASEGRVAVGPDAGGVDGLGSKPANITVPGLSVRAENVVPGNNPWLNAPKPLPPMSAPSPRRPPGAGTVTVSVPLWPQSRRLEPLIESRFHEQVAYVTVVNSLLGTNSAVDWILWFGERGSTKTESGVRVLMRPPAPLKRISIPALMSAPAGQGQKIHIAGVVGNGGRLGSLAVLGDGGPEAAILLNALEGCEFTPAFRNGVPVDVDVVIEISGVQLVSRAMDNGK